MFRSRANAMGPTRLQSIVVFFVCFISFSSCQSAQNGTDNLSETIRIPDEPFLILNTTENRSNEQTDLLSAPANSSTVIVIGDVEDVEEKSAEVGPLTNRTTDNSGDGTEGLTNITALPEVMEGGDGVAPAPPIGVSESAMILAATFIIMAVAGYGVMVFYRRVLQVRYGTSEMLITDDAYDISDLRNFEI